VKPKIMLLLRYDVEEKSNYSKVENNEKCE
jgi:hypothetical protein